MMKSPLLKRAASLLGVLLAGCVNYSGIAPHSTLTTSADLALQAQTLQWPNDHSWEVLNDPVLNDLMRQALDNNPDIRIAQARLAKVAAMTKVAEAGRWPEAAIDASMMPERITENGLYPPPFAGSIYSTNTLMVDANYEFDFWGKNRSALNAAISNEKAAQAEIHSARLIIETSVAKSYFTLGHHLEQKKILEKTLAQRDELFNLTHRRLEAGLDTRQDMKISKQGIPAIKSDIIRLDEQISLARNALAALIGKGPDATKDLVAVLPGTLNNSIPDSVPADLVGRRADITAARLRAEAASSQIDMTKAEFYPNVNLSAFAGFSSLGFGHWLEWSSRDYGVGPAISLPIFDAGRLRAKLGDRTADYDIAVESYNQTLIEAIHDVADQLTSLRSVVQMQKQQDELQRSAENVLEIAQQREKAGLVNRATVLNAESAVLAQLSAANDLKTRSIELNINLIRALGGGFNGSMSAKEVAATK